jgi:hypothetical protein
MSDEIPPQQMAVDDLAQRCQLETNKYFKHLEHDDQYCFELFRRAIQEQDTFAWEIIYVQYESLVSGWVSQHSGFPSTGEKVEFFVNGAFGKISGSLSAEKFSSFSDLGYLLRYLKMCVHSMITDYNRAADYGEAFTLDDAADEKSQEPSPEEQTTAHLSHQAIWEQTLARMHDEKERAVILGSFALDLKPQEIYNHYRHVFTDVDEIYRVKQNIISRLRRDSEYRKLIDVDA